MRKTIEGFEHYEITDDGRVWSKPRQWQAGYLPRSHDGKWLKVRRNCRTGYLEVCLTVDGRSSYQLVHRLLAKAFIPNPSNLPQVNHINGDPGDCRLSNLEWCSRSYNTWHAYNVLERPTCKGDKHPIAKLSDQQVLRMRELFSTGLYTQRDFCVFLNLAPATVSNILNRKAWKHI